MLWQPTRGVIQPNQHWRRPQGAAAGLVLIDRTAGTNIGNMTAGDYGGTLAKAFDGVTAGTFNSSPFNYATSLTTNGWLGKTLASAKAFGKATIYGTNNVGYVVGAGPTLTAKAYGKQGSAPASGTDGTEIGTISFADADDEHVGRDITSTDTSTLWDHLFVNITGAGNFFVVELELYEWA